MQEAMRVKRVNARPAPATLHDEPPEFSQTIVNLEAVHDLSPFERASSVLEPSPLVGYLPSISFVLQRHELLGIDASLRPASGLSFYSSRDGSSSRISVFTKGASITTKPSSESIGSGHLRLINTLDLEVPTDTRKPGPTVVSNNGRVVSIPTLTLSTAEMRDTTVDISALTQMALGPRICVIPPTPIRASATTEHGPNSILEAKTSSRPPAMPPQTHNSMSSHGCSGGARPLKEYEESNTFAVMQDAHDLHERQRAEELQSCFSSSTTEIRTSHRQRLGSKATAIKCQFQAVASTTKRITHRCLRSAKKLRITASHLAPVAIASRSPYETIVLA